jgi:pyruvate/2-oxoglutarate/acetoin dehydrogenase E1 component
VDLIELTCLKPFDKATIETSLKRTHKLAILDESTRSGGVGATMSALVSETLFDELDAPVLRLCMEGTRWGFLKSDTHCLPVQY